MKKYLLIIIGLVLLGVAIADTLTYGPTSYVKNVRSSLSGSTKSDPIYLFINEVDDTFGGTESIDLLLFNSAGADPSALASGQFWFDTAANTMKFTNNGGSATSLASASGNSLDQSYDAGVAITVDNGAVAMTSTDAANNVVLAIDQADTAGAVGMTIVSAGTGALLSFDSNGTGGDLLGSDSAWTISKAGAFTGESFTGVTWGQAISFDADNEIQFGDNSEDIAFTFTSANRVLLTTDSGVDQFSFGVVDDLTNVASITGDTGEDFAIGATNTGTFNVTLSQVGTGDNQVIIASAGTATNAIALTASVAGITATALDDITVQVTSSTGGEDILITQVGGNDSSITLTAAGTGADAIGLVATAGGIAVTAVDDLILTNASSAGADDLVIQQTGAFDASVLIKSAGTGDDAISAVSSAGGVLVQSTGATDNHVVISSSGTSANALQLVTTAGGIDITNGGASGENLVIDGVLSAVTINSDEATTDSIDISSSLGGITMTSTAVASAWTHTATGAGDDLTLSVAGAVNSSLHLLSAGTAVDAISVAASAGGITMASQDVASTWTHTANGAADDLSFIVAGAFDGSLVLTSSGTAANAIDINATAGGIDIDITGAAATEDFAVTTDSSITFIASEAVADQFKVDATGAVVGDAINLETTAGGIILTADGGTDGDIELNAEDDIFLITTGSLTITNTDAMTVSGASTLTGAVTATTGVQFLAISGEPTADGTGDGAIAAGTSFVTTVDPGAATDWYTLPAAVPGTIIWISTVDDSTGFEIRSSAPASIAINGGSGGGFESAIPSTASLLRLVCTNATNWTGTMFDADGDEAKIPAAN